MKITSLILTHNIQIKAGNGSIEYVPAYLGDVSRPDWDGSHYYRCAFQDGKQVLYCKAEHVIAVLCETE